MSSRLANEWITDLDDKISWAGIACQKTLNKLPLSCRYPELDVGKGISNPCDSFEVFE
jgi:hypothetical protein